MHHLAVRRQTGPAQHVATRTTLILTIGDGADCLPHVRRRAGEVVVAAIRDTAGQAPLRVATTSSDLAGTPSGRAGFDGDGGGSRLPLAWRSHGAVVSQKRAPSGSHRATRERSWTDSAASVASLCDRSAHSGCSSRCIAARPGVHVRFGIASVPGAADWRAGHFESRHARPGRRPVVLSGLCSATMAEDIRRDGHPPSAALWGG